MKNRIRLLSALAAVCLVLYVIFAASGGDNHTDVLSALAENTGKTTIRVWYNDEALTDYMTAQAVLYNESHSKVRIEPAYVSGVEYLETINRASLEGENYPDLFIITNDVLEKAQLAGLTTEIGTNDPYLRAEYFPQTALDAVTYHDRYVAYPFYYETVALLYNRTFLAQSAKDQIEDEKIEANPEAEAGDEALQVSEEEISQRVREMLPSTLADLLRFANEYEAPENVEAVFEWDVNDIFYNYFFVGGHMDTGGPAGDDIFRMDLYNPDTIRCMTAYRQLAQFFAIDSSEVSYEQVLDDFIAGKIVFTVATSDAMSKLRSALASGESSYSFGITRIPDWTDTYQTKTMSVTDCVVVNGYSANPQTAAGFARFLISTADERMYELTGKLPARMQTFTDPGPEAFFEVYADSVPMPKMIETSNLWMRLEIAFTEIWNGADPNQTMKALSEIIMKQVLGREYIEQTLPEPEPIPLTDELWEDGE